MTDTVESSAAATFIPSMELDGVTVHTHLFFTEDIYHLSGLALPVHRQVELDQVPSVEVKVMDIMTVLETTSNKRALEFWRGISKALKDITRNPTIGPLVTFSLNQGTLIEVGE